MTTRAQIELVGAPRPRRVMPLSLLSDEALADRVATEGERAFEVIYRRHRQRLYAYCAAVLRQPEDAEEALQSAMLGAYRALRASPGREMSLHPWLHRIAHNQCIDVIRRRPGGAAPLSDREASRDPGPAERSETAEALARLREDLRSLPGDQREALVLRELSGLSHTEIGAVLGEEPARVKQLIHQARRGLSRMAEGRDLDCREVRERLSDADGRVTRAQGVRAHVRTCCDCRRFRQEIATRPARLAALVPVLPVAAAERIMAALGGGVAGGGALAGGAGSGVLSAVGGALASKAAIVTAVAVVGGTIAVAPVVRPDTSPPAPRPARVVAVASAPAHVAPAVPSSHVAAPAAAALAAPAAPVRQPPAWVPTPAEATAPLVAAPSPAAAVAPPTADPAPPAAHPPIHPPAPAAPPADPPEDGRADAPGQATAPEQAGPPGQATAPGQATGPGQAGAPGQAIAPGQAGARGQANPPGQATAPGQAREPGPARAPGQATAPGRNRTDP